MKRIGFLFLLLLAVCLITVPIPGKAFGTESSDEYAFKVAVENRLEERLLYLLSGIVGTEKLVVIVNAHVEELKKKKPVQKKKSSQRKLVLPGVPVKKEIGKETKKPDIDLSDLPPSIIKKLVVTVLVDSSVPETLFDTMRDVAINAIGYDPDRGDMLNINQVDFSKKKYDWSTLFHPPDLYWVIILTFSGIFLLGLTFFILNPFKKLTGVLRNINWEALRGAGGGSGMGEKETVSQNPLAEAEEAMEDERLDDDRPLPFSFIKERHISEVAFLLKNAPAKDVAIVANYLSPDLAVRLIENYDEDRQTEIALQLSGEEEVTPDKVQELEDSLRKRLDYVMGGEDKLAPILDFTEDVLRETVFDKLDGTNADIANRLRRKVKSYESIMRDLSPQGIQALFRHDPTTLARLLKSSPQDIQDRVMQSLSEGAVERLQEEIELSRPFTEERLKKEKFNVITMVRRMVRAGIIEEGI